MDSISRNQKLSEDLIHVEQCEEDRISNLPNSLIGHILSLLPTKNAVATSVLSTRWKQHWTLITTLDFDDELLLFPLLGNKVLPSLQKIFTSFVYRVLLLRRVSVPSLHKFHLNCSQRYDASDVNAWIASALLCNAQELDLSIPMEYSTLLLLPLPRDLFCCRTLVVLKLGTKFLMNVPSAASVCLASLKMLHLDTVKFLDDDSINRLLCGCPVLEELSMSACLGTDVNAINIFAPLLTSLIVSFMPCYYIDSDDVFEYKIVLDTPALVYIEINGCAGDGYSIMNLHHLSKAHINITRSRYEFNSIHSQAISDLLRGISNVQFLHLTGDFMETIHVYEPELPKFHNVTCLELGADSCVRWSLLPVLLQKSPRLRTLVFKEGLVNYDDDDSGWNPPQKVPSCLLSHLKVIEISNFEGHKEEMKMVKYFLKNAKVLEKLSLHYISPQRKCTEDIMQDQLNVSKELLMIERGSRTCQIVHLLSY